jgi:CRP-like cAMP-binding protein
MSARLSSVFPRPTASDPDDVVWTLQTAAVQWQRGLRADAIVWVRKAADLSNQLGRTPRAEELRNQAARLAEYLWSDPEEPAGGSNGLPAGAAPGRGAEEEDEEHIEVEELDVSELEFGEAELPTPEDAAADISPEDLRKYARPSAPAPLPDDLDLELATEPPARAPARALSSHDSFLSINPESERPGDSFISVSPEPDEGEEYLLESPDARAPATLAESHFSLPPSDYPTQPRIERPPSFLPREPGLARPSAPPTPLAPMPPSRGMDSFSPPTAPSAFSGAASTPFPPPPAAVSRGAPASVRLESEPAPSSQTEAPLELVRPLVTPSAAAALGEGSPSVDGLAFESVEALADLPEEAQAELAAAGQLLQLAAGKELMLSEGASLVTQGHVHVTLPFSDVSAGRVGAGAVVAARGSVESGPLRLIADGEQTHLVRWSDEQLTSAMRDCPWVVDDLRQLADRLYAHAGAGLGPLGARLDDALRAAVYERMQVRVLAPDEVVAERGKALKGLFVVAVGELLVGAEGAEKIAPGDFVFPGSVIGAEPAPADVKASAQGALVLFATRPVAHELMMSVPPLLEILSS